MSHKALHQSAESKNLYHAVSGLSRANLLKLIAAASQTPIHIWGTPGAENVANIQDPSKPVPWNPFVDNEDAFCLMCTCSFQVVDNGDGALREIQFEFERDADSVERYAVGIEWPPTPSAHRFALAMAGAMKGYLLSNPVPVKTSELGAS